MNTKKLIRVAASIVLFLVLCSCTPMGAEEIVPSQTATPKGTAAAETPMSTAALTLQPSPMPTLGASAKPSDIPMPTPSTTWGAKFVGKFTYGEVIQTDSSYISEHVNVSINKVQEDGLTYYLADIYITDLKYFISPFSDGGYYKGERKFVYKIAREINAVVAINGDYYAENAGPILRDGILYRNEVKCDILIMFKDGTMKTYSSNEYDEDSIAAMQDNVWQIWTFGPMLLKDGEPLTEFDFSKNVGGINPRSVIGYYEPGHYLFVTVDGRQPGYSDGLNMQELSQLMYELGCRVAFNLDGGGTAQMAYLGEEISQPSVHRKTRDALCIVDEPAP